jgi:hypothetical protein
VVPVTSAAAERLHVLVHRAMLASRELPDWWGSPLESALAAAALARHSRSYWDEAERPVTRLLRWWREEGPRRTSADTAALALTARAAAELQRKEPELVNAAAEAVDELARRDQSIVPELHLALCAWAMDPLVSDREMPPWPKLRDRHQPSRVGVDEPLSWYTQAIASRSLDASELVRELVRTVGSAASPSDSCILLWLITASNDRLVLLLPSNDNALQVLIRRRSEIAERLVAEIDERSFRESDAWDSDMSADISTTDVVHLSSFEAELADFALASRDPIHPWLTREEAIRVFGEETTALRVELASTRIRMTRTVSALIAVFGLSLGGVLWLSLRLAGIGKGIGNLAAVALVAFALTASVAVTGRGREGALIVEALGVFFATLGLLATAVAINLAARKLLISDVGGLIAGTLIASAAAVVWVIVRRVAKGHQR